MQHENPQVRELLELKAQGKYDYQLKTYLKNKGYDEGKIKFLMQVANGIYLQKEAKKFRIIWSVLAGVISIIYLFFIPIDLYNIISTPLSLFGGILVGVLIGAAVSGLSFKSIPSMVNPLDTLKVGGIVGIVASIALVFLFNANFSWMKNRELKNYGVVTNSIISDAYTTKGRRGSTNRYAKFRFKDDKGKVYDKKVSVNKETYSYLSIGKQTLVIYSKRNPEICHLLEDKELREMFLKD